MAKSLPCFLLPLILSVSTLWADTPNDLFIPPPPSVTAKSYLVVDASNNTVVAHKDEHKRLDPASLTKLLTLYITADALKEGHISLDDKVYISKKAWQTSGSRMFIQEGKYVSVADLIQGIAVASGNDATVAIAEHIAGSTEAFAALMNKTAEQLGMQESHFTNPTGLPHKEHYTTAHDLALLAGAWLNDFPDYYHWFSQKHLQFAGIKQLNRNRLLWRDPSVDGLKTGHTDDAGFCLVTSAKRDDTRMLAVLLGSSSDQTRFQDAQQLYSYAFRFYATKVLAEANTPLYQARVWQGNPSMVPAGVKIPLSITLNRYEKRKVSLIPNVSSNIKAPVKKGDQVGSLSVVQNDQTLTSVPLIALEDSQTGSFWRQWVDWIKQQLA